MLGLYKFLFLKLCFVKIIGCILILKCLFFFIILFLTQLIISLLFVILFHEIHITFSYSNTINIILIYYYSFWNILRIFRSLKLQLRFEIFILNLFLLLKIIIKILSSEYILICIWFILINSICIFVNLMIL